MTGSDFAAHIEDTVMDQYAADVTAPVPADGGAVLTGPFRKDAEHYLSRSDWHGAPVLADRIGPWGLGSVCWYYRVEKDGDRLFVAAETAELALRAALFVIAPDLSSVAKERDRLAGEMDDLRALLRSGRPVPAEFLYPDQVDQ